MVKKLLIFSLITASNNATSVSIQRDIAVVSTVDKLSLLTPIKAARPGEELYVNLIGRGKGDVGMTVAVSQGESAICVDR